MTDQLRLEPFLELSRKTPLSNESSQSVIRIPSNSASFLVLSANQSAEALWFCLAALRAADSAR